MFKKIVRYFANMLLHKAYRSRERSAGIKTINNSKIVGILWNPADEGSIETFEALRKILQLKGIKPTGMAYVSSLREKQTLATIASSEFLNKRDVRLFGGPKTNEGIQFINEPFDILIDLSIFKTLALQYILVHSRAKFIVGWHGTEPNYFDFNIDVSERARCRYLMEQIVYYLENINEKSLIRL